MPSMRWIESSSIQGNSFSNFTIHSDQYWNNEYNLVNGQLNYYWTKEMESPPAEQRSVLQTMTAAMKLYKLILQRLESDYKLERYEDYSGGSTIELHISDLLKLAGIIEISQCTQMLNNRLVNRFLEITTMYTNKLQQSPLMISLKGHMSSILILIRQYQTNHTIASPFLNSTALRGVTRIDILNLFDGICCVLKKCVRQLREKALKTNPISLVAIKNYEVSNIKEKEKQKRFFQVEASTVKSMQQKYKKVKDNIINTSIFSGMDIDTAHLKALCQQVTHSLEDLQSQKIQANQVALKARDQFIESYSKWKLRAKRKSMKKQRMLQYNLTSPRPKIINQNKTSDLNESLMKTVSMPKGIEDDNQCRVYVEEDKKRKQFKNMQALTYNRQFIHLSEIKNQRIAKRPYAQVKQVLVAGDELNYYSNKYNNSPFTHTSTKTTFFMQRAVKNENLTLRRKPYLENCRIATSE